MTTETPIDESTLNKEGPGAQLKSKRLASNRSLEDVAHEMHMNVWQVEALEENAYERLGGSVFVQGYIRTYSRLLEIDAQPLLNEFAALNVQEPRWKMHPPIEEAPGKSVGLAVFTALISAALVAAFVVWLNANGYLGTSFGFKPSIEVSNEIAVEQEEADSAPVLLENGHGDGTQQLVLPGQPLESLLEEKDMEAAEEPPVEPTSDAAPASAPSEEKPSQESEESNVDAGKQSEESSASEPPTASQTSQAVVTEPAEPAREKPVQNDSPAGVSGASVVSLSLEEDSWIEVRDASGKFLIHGLRKAGFTAKIDGKAPYQVFLGNAPGVAIEVNGSLFDTKSFVRENRTARFLLLQE